MLAATCRAWGWTTLPFGVLMPYFLMFLPAQSPHSLCAACHSALYFVNNCLLGA